MATEHLEVTVPEGVSGGMAILVEFAGLQHNVAVPEGYSAGQVMRIGFTQVEVGVPPGISAGMAINVDWGGQQQTIVVPDGLSEGMGMMVWFSVPEGLDPAQQEAKVTMVDMHPDDAANLGAGLAANEDDAGGAAPAAADAAFWQGRTADSANNEFAVPIYAVGSRMQVLRSDESYSPCTITAATPTAMGPMYDVMLDDGNTKSGVAEDTLIAG